MLRLLLCTFSCAFACTLLATPASAHPSYSPNVSYLHARSPMAGYRYHQLSYHRESARLDRLVRLRKSEIALLERQIKELEPLDRFRTGRPVMLDISRTQLQLAELKYELECLQQRRFDLTHARGRM